MYEYDLPIRCECQHDVDRTDICILLYDHIMQLLGYGYYIHRCTYLCIVMAHYPPGPACTGQQPGEEPPDIGTKSVIYLTGINGSASSGLSRAGGHGLAVESGEHLPPLHFRFLPG